MTFLIDIDNTITNLNRVWLEEINERYNTNYQYSNITSWDFFDSLDGVDYFGILSSPVFWTKVRVYPNAVKCIEDLVKHGHKVYLSTASHVLNEAINAKMNSVLSAFDPDTINFNNVIISQDKTMIKGDILIDDKLETAKAWQNTGRFAIIPTQPWNVDDNSVDWKNVDWSVDTLNDRWSDIHKYLNKNFN